MKKIINLFKQVWCKYCGREIASTGGGTNHNGMCERCYENGGDEE
jgi:NMD protein affecting ribosome stability and mRNA decay